jgi:hypothetical protein
MELIEFAKEYKVLPKFRKALIQAVSEYQSTQSFVGYTKLTVINQDMYDIYCLIRGNNQSEVAVKLSFIPIIDEDEVDLMYDETNEYVLDVNDLEDLIQLIDIQRITNPRGRAARY